MHNDIKNVDHRLWDAANNHIKTQLLKLPIESLRSKVENVPKLCLMDHMLTMGHAQEN
jgi:hypothetical protein